MKTFEEKEKSVKELSPSYVLSTAFREALEFVRNRDEYMYEWLINMEYKETFSE